MRTSICFLLTAGAVAACSTTGQPKTASTVGGKLDSATFALAAPTAMDAIDESSTRTHGVVAPDGTFTISLTKGHAYRLVALTPKGEEPLVFPRTNGRLDTTFRISSGAAVVNLGTIRHFDRAPSTFSVTDDGKTSCEGGGQGADDEADGECENGKDAKTGLACSDTEETDAADPAKPMAVPEKNPPADVSGCEDGADDGESAD